MKNYRGVTVYQCTNRGEKKIKAAIAIFNTDIDVIQCVEYTTPNIAVVKIKTSAWEIVVVSFYFEPDTPIEPFLNQLESIVNNLGPTKIIIGGDSNSKNIWWGSNKIDNRGEELAATLHELGLEVLNEGDTPTFCVVRGNKIYTSHIDITACSADIYSLIEHWKVNEHLVESDHNAIVFNIRLKKANGVNIKRSTRIYNTKRANWDQFHVKLTQFAKEHNITKKEIKKIQNKIDLEKKLETLNQIIVNSCNLNIPKLKSNSKIKIPWWTDELGNLKKSVITKKRRIRWAAPIRRQKTVEEYLQAKQKYESEVKRLKISSWKEFCEKQDGGCGKAFTE